MRKSKGIECGNSRMLQLEYLSPSFDFMKASISSITPRENPAAFLSKCQLLDAMAQHWIAIVPHRIHSGKCIDVNTINQI